MNVQAVNSLMHSRYCQPVKPVSFMKHSDASQNKTIQQPCDCFDNSQSTDMLEKKYDLACRLAAYYKTQYESLQKQGACNA